MIDRIVKIICCWENQFREFPLKLPSRPDTSDKTNHPDEAGIILRSWVQ
jgi:hypothetical protein